MKQTKGSTMAATGRRRGLRRVGSLVRGVAATVVAALALTGTVAAGPAAAADAVLTVSVTPVHHLTGEPVTETSYGQHDDRLAYRVSYACSVADCTGAEVRFSPSQPDPYGLAALAPSADYSTPALLAYETWTRPNGAPDVTPTGDDLTGKVFQLGDLAAGDSGTFLVTYQVEAEGTSGFGATARAGQFYPDGFEIVMGVEASAENVPDPVEATAAPVVWHNEVPDPSVAIVGAERTVSVDDPLTLTNRMGSGAFPLFVTGGPYRDAYGTTEWVAAGSYTVTQTLPPEAEVVDTDGGVYDEATHTITWTRGTEDEPVYDAAGGWGSPESAWYTRDNYRPHRVELRFPGENFADADADGCNFEATVPVSLSVEATYLDAARTTKSADTTVDVVVACWDPFGTGTTAKDTSRTGTDGPTRLIEVPDAGEPANEYRWTVSAGNGSNQVGTAVIEDTFDQENLDVFEIALSAPGTIEWELDDGQTGTTTGSRYQAPEGTSIVSMRVTSGDIQPARAQPGDRTFSWFNANVRYRVQPGSPVDVERVNTATSTMSWPDAPELEPQETEASRTVRLVETPRAVPEVVADFSAAPAVEGGGSAVPDRDVTFSVAGSVTDMPSDSPFTPQYVFIAPEGWTVSEGTATFSDAPDGVTFDYATRTVDGVERDVVVAVWPDATTFDDYEPLPTMTVVAKPTFAVAAGTTSVAHAWIGDSTRTWDDTEADFREGTQNTDDVDGSGDVAAWFATTSQSVAVSAADSLTVVKEICQPDPTAADGCEWIADPDRVVQVPANATSIGYRVTLQNSGNTSLGDVVAYDVLPHVGDTGITPSTASTPRGSELDQSLSAVTGTSPNVELAFSASTDPDRPEVHPEPGDDDWSAEPAGMRSVRALVTGDLAPGETASFVLTAAIEGAVGADALACNSVAVASDRTLASEPRPVCAVTTEADLVAGGADAVDGQVGRPVVVPFEFENLGGSAEAEAVVTLSLPAGVRVDGLAPDGWTCTADGTAPVEGPATLECTPTEMLTTGSPAPLLLEATVTRADPEIVALVDGPTYDSDETNNEHTVLIRTTEAAGDLEVEKSDARSAVVPGQETTYSITVTNPLDHEELTGVTVVDEVPAGTELVSASDDGQHADGDVTWVVETIPAGGSVEVSMTVRVLEDAGTAITNTATATVDDPAFEGTTLSGEGTDVNVVDRVVLTKTATPADPADARPGDVVTYRFTITNAGGGPLSGIELDDPMPGLSQMTYEPWPTLPGHLGSGQSVSATATYTLTADDVDGGELQNTATVRADSADGGVATDDAGHTVEIAHAPGIQLAKSGETSGADAGDVVTYTFDVENTGNVTLTDVAIVDDLPDLSALTFGAWPGDEGVLPAGGSVVATATYELTQDDVDAGSVDNTATAAGSAPDTTTVESSDTATVLLASHPALTFEKTGAAEDPARTSAGGTVTFTFEIENAGNVTLDDVTVDDALPGLSPISDEGWPQDAGVLAPGESVTATATYVTDQDDVDAGGVDNEATVTGTAPDGQTAVAQDATRVPVPADPSLSVTKSGRLDAGAPAAGDTVTYTFVTTNTGTSTVADVALDDQLDGLSSIEFGPWPGGEPGVLAPSEEVSATATYVITQQDLDRGRVDNVVEATGTAANGGSVSALDGDTVALPAVAGVTLDKSGQITDVAPRAGDLVDYTFVVTNAGNVTLEGVEIDDQLDGVSAVTFGPWPGSPGELSPGAEVRATATYAVTQADLDGGEVVNVATVSATGVRGGAVTDGDTSTVPLGAEPAVALDKSAGSTADVGAAGDAFDYTFVVTNTGNVTLSGVEVSDALAGLSEITYGEWPAEPGTLAPAESVVARATYHVSQDDLDTGEVFNEATVGAAGARGGLVDARDDVTVVLDGDAALRFTKTGALADPTRPLAGDTATFTFEVENTGSVTIADLTIDDELEGVSDVVFDDWPGEPGSLAPGQLVTATASYAVSQAEIDAGVLENTATATASSLRGDALEEASSVTVPLESVPGLALTKRAALDDGDGNEVADPGEEITYSFDLTNVGNTTVFDAQVDDPMVTGVDGVDELAPGQTVTVTAAPYAVTVPDGAAGSVDNTASAAGSDPDGRPVVSPESTVSTPSAAAPTVDGQTGELPRTGADVGSAVLVAMALLVAFGCLLLVAARWRRS
ncbi:hypothetical protein UQW22_07410 [Isoptericola halotolerans]|uniref:DUF7507 domain-containing protein n=1 Tax=Isoptericola halotolerans TaxID=300560 RepID=UPI00388DB05E